MMFLNKFIELFLAKARSRQKPSRDHQSNAGSQPGVDPAPDTGQAVTASLVSYNHLYSKEKDIYGDEFYNNLIKTIGWTEKIMEEIKDLTDIDYSRTLRSVNPVYNGQPFYSYDSENRHACAATPDIPFNYLPLLQEALLMRNYNIINIKQVVAAGNIIRFEIDCTTHDGVPVFESEGFVDESDIPPIDTWFFVTSEHLYCWIPSLFIEKMQRAMDVEIFDSYKWLEECNPGLNNKLLHRIECQ